MQASTDGGEDGCEDGGEDDGGEDPGEGDAGSGSSSEDDSGEMGRRGKSLGQHVQPARVPPSVCP